MAKPRKTKDERDQERANAQRRAWEQFSPKLDALTSLGEARSLIAEKPRLDSLDRLYYTNLELFLMSNFKMVPDGSIYAEKQLYLQFIQRLDAAGALPPGDGQMVQEKLRCAMAEQRY